MGSVDPSATASSPWRQRHLWFVAALAVGIAVRVVVMVAYRPAMLFPDGFDYLDNARHLGLSQFRPQGYALFLRPIVLLTDSLMPIAVIQHLIGLGMATACYAFLLRRGLPGWAATLAVLPLLLDPLQLVLEHYVLSDVLFEALLVAACLTLLWRHRPGIGAVVVAGALVGTAGTVRGAGDFLLVVFLVGVLCLRPGWTKVVAFLTAGILPIAAYMGAFHALYGHYALTTSGPRFLYARVAPVAQCQDPQLALPGYERMLCPRKPVGHRPNTNWYMWHIEAPQWRVRAPSGLTQAQVVKDFDKRVVRAEPIVYTRAVLKDFAGGFAPTRTHQVPGYPSSYWLFADHYWSMDTFMGPHGFKPTVLRGMSSDPAAAHFMTTYRRWVYTPGPLMAALVLVGAGAAIGLGRARDSGCRLAVGLLATACFIPLLTGAAFSGFSWRYQLPQIALLPMAGALGLAALVRGGAAGQPMPPHPLRFLDRSAARLAELPLAPAWQAAMRRAAERGELQTVIGVVTGAGAAFLSAAFAVASGWFLPGFAALLGVALGILTVVTLLVARSRTESASATVADRPADVPEPEGLIARA